MTLTVQRVLFFVACILFVVAALFAGNVLTGDYLPWTLGGFSAVALAWAAP